MNRRSFLKTAIAGAVGLAALPVLAKPETHEWIDLTSDYVLIPGEKVVAEAKRQGEKNIEFVATPVFSHPVRGICHAKTYSYPIRFSPDCKRIRLDVLVAQLNFFFSEYYTTHVHSAAILSPLPGGHRPVIVRAYHDWRNHPPKYVRGQTTFVVMLDEWTKMEKWSLI